MLYVADFMASYGEMFGVIESDLNGDILYKFSKFMSRRNVVMTVMKELVVDGFATVMRLDSGITYTITSYGEELCEMLDSDYAREYRKAAAEVLISSRSERSVMSYIKFTKGATKYDTVSMMESDDGFSIQMT